VVSGGTLVISTDGGWLFGIDTATESIAWQRDLDTKLNADLTLDEDAVLLAPQGCVTPEAGGEKIYYTSVNPLNGDLMFATGVC
jgi:outer membrane protein assembly factor BamB